MRLIRNMIEQSDGKIVEIFEVKFEAELKIPNIIKLEFRLNYNFDINQNYNQ